MPEPELALEPGGLRVPEGIGRSPAALDAFPSVFRGLSPATVAAAVGHFDVFEVQAGTTLIEAGEHHPALVMVLGGELRAMRGDSMRIASEGECLGVTTLFGDGRWASTLRAVVPSRLLVLDLEGFRALREQGSVVSVAVEEYALDTLMDALDRARQRVGQLVRGKPIKTFVPSPGFFGLIADAFGMGGIMSTQLPAARLLADSPLFRNADSAHIEALAERFIGLRAQAGTFLLTQGVSNTSMFMVASGTVDLLTASTDNSAVCHETLGPGQMFGIWGLLRELPSRTSVVAKQNCTVLELEKLAWAELAPAHTGTGSVLRLAVLRALTGRLVQEAAKLASLEAGEVPVVVDTSDSFKTINPIDRR
jgi:CRP-like cAMP-binding protein